MQCSSYDRICYLISVLSLYAHIIPLLYSQLDSFVWIVVIPNQSYVTTKSSSPGPVGSKILSPAV